MILPNREKRSLYFHVTIWTAALSNIVGAVLLLVDPQWCVWYPWLFAVTLFQAAGMWMYFSLY